MLNRLLIAFFAMGLGFSAPSYADNHMPTPQCKVSSCKCDCHNSEDNKGKPCDKKNCKCDCHAKKDGSQCNCKMNRMDKKGKMASELSLTSEQSQAFKTIRGKYREEYRKGVAMKRQLHAKIMDMATQTKLDNEKLESLLKQRSDLSSKLLKLRVKMKNEMYNVLNADQQQKMKQYFSAKREQLNKRLQDNF